MVDDRIAKARARIDAAASRIEAVVKTPVDPELAVKYAALRQEAGAVLGQLDRLIGDLER